MAARRLHGAFMQSAKMKPDGSVEVGDERYRLVEVARTQFRLERLRDGAIVGEVNVPPHGKPEATPANPAEAAVVEAVAALLESPRGLLPLQ